MESDDLLDAGREAARLPATTTGEELAQDKSIAAAILRKDRKAAADFIARHADPVYRYVRSRLIPRTDLVDDLVQDVFITAWDHLASYRGDAPLGAWLLGIARHKVENYYRECLRAPLPLEGADPEAGLIEADMDELLDRQRLREKTQRVLASLPETYSRALLWRYWEQCSAREMAMRTGKTEKAIERLLARARATFREQWERRET